LLQAFNDNLGGWVVSDRFVVEGLEQWRWDAVKSFDAQEEAFDYAKFLERRGKCDRIRIVVETHRNGRARRLVTYLGNECPRRPVAAQAPPRTTWLARMRGTVSRPVLKDVAYAARVLTGTVVALAVGAGLIAGLQVVG
jgi:hypothetical protein